MRCTMSFGSWWCLDYSVCSAMTWFVAQFCVFKNKFLILLVVKSVIWMVNIQRQDLTSRLFLSGPSRQDGWETTKLTLSSHCCIMKSRILFTMLPTSDCWAASLASVRWHNVSAFSSSYSAAGSVNRKTNIQCSLQVIIINSRVMTMLRTSGHSVGWTLENELFWWWMRVYL